MVQLWPRFYPLYVTVMLSNGGSLRNDLMFAELLNDRIVMHKCRMVVYEFHLGFLHFTSPIPVFYCYAGYLL